MYHRLRMLVVLFAVSGCTTAGPSRLIGRDAPEISLQALDGREVSLSGLRGRVIVLDFWATWCPPCRESLPHLAKLAADPEMAQHGLTVLAVNERENAATVRTFLEQNHYAFEVVRDIDGSAARAFGASSLPTTIVIGRDGMVQAVVNGWTEDTARQIDQAVAQAIQASATKI